ncbi:MAG: hypothetical protein Q7R43_03675 [Candidatus Daviesbacteria bacterium]|nr:hypothetical protein [Candidatus Daviesbacteria bacterium]
MIILPIKHIREEDQPIFGANLFNLGKLERNSFPVHDGIAISPPEIILETILKHLETQKSEIFEQKLEIIKKEIANIPQPEDLIRDLKNQRNFYLNEKIIKDKKLLWLKLLEVWLNEIRNNFIKNGFSPRINDLKAQVIFFVDDKFISINAFYEPKLEEVIIESQEKLNPEISQKIDQLVMDGNKKLLIPQNYKFLLVKNQLKLIKLFPYTQTLPLSSEKNLIINKPEQKKLVKSAVKLFLNLSSGYAVGQNLDGVLIEAENVLGFDERAFKLAESALTFHNKPVIFKLPDVVNDKEIRGTLRLLNQKSLLKEAVDVFFFVRVKKNLFNLELAIPFLRSSDELMEIKREILSMGLSRKGSLKFWVEFKVPENFINLEKYLEVGFDGAILDLDFLQKSLGGYDIEEGEFYKKQVQTLIKFLEPAFKIFHQYKIPVLVKGSLNLYPDVLEFLVEKGVWGVVVNSALEADSIPEHLSFAEKRMIMKRG